MRLEETLNGGYNGLYGEVVDKDIYHVRDVADIVSINDPTYIHEKGHTGIKFVPDVVFDLGANVGIFTRYARSLWPNARIISVEPHPGNIEVFKHFTQDPNITLLEAAVGKGELWHFGGAVNGSGESYISPGMLMPKSEMNRHNTQRSDIPMVMPGDLIKKYVNVGEKFLVKIDIEGAENAIFTDPESMKALSWADYLCMEVHYYSLSHGDQAKDKTIEALSFFNQTHHCILDHVTFYATKK